jgi:hypothetical protein
MQADVFLGGAHLVFVAHDAATGAQFQQKNRGAAFSRTLAARHNLSTPSVDSATSVSKAVDDASKAQMPEHEALPGLPVLSIKHL